MLCSAELARLIMEPLRCYHYLSLETKFIILLKPVNEIQYVCLNSLRYKTTGMNLTLESIKIQIQEKDLVNLN